MAEQPLRILFVEDVPEDKELAERALRKEGLLFNSIRVDTAEDFRSALDEFKPDIVVSDYSMPQFDGMAALKISLERDALLPFIVLTGAQNEEVAVACIKAGATDYVLKERLARLPFAVKEALDQSHVRAGKEAAERELIRLQKAVDNSGEAIFMTDRDGLITFINPEFTRLYGFTAEETVGKVTPRILKSGRVADEDYKKFWDAILSRQVARGEIVNKTKDGRLLVVDSSVNPTLDERGEINGFLAIQRDITARKNAEDELRNLSRAVEQSNASIVITDVTGIIEYVNPFFSKITGYTFDEAIGQNPRILKSGLTPEGLYKELWDTITAGGNWSGEFCNQKKSGELYWEAASISPISGPSGSIMHYVAVKTDITERKRMDAALRVAEADYRSLFENAPVGIYQSTLEGRFRKVNKALADIFGYASPDEMIESVQSIENQFYTDPASRREYQRQLEENGEVLGFESRCTHKDGRVVWISEDARIVKDESGAALCYEGFIQNITDRKRAEDDLRGSEERFRTLAEQMPLGLSLISADGKYEYVNPSYISLMGYDISQVPTGRDWFQLAFPDTDERHKVIDTWKSDLAQAKPGETRPREYLITCGDGSKKTILFRPVTMSDGRQFVLYENITERKQAEQAQRESEMKFRRAFEDAPVGMALVSLKEEFVEVNQALCTILGYSEEQLLNGMTVPQVTHSDDLAVEAKFKKQTADGEIKSFQFEKRYIHADGRVIWGNLSVSAVTDDAGNPLYFIGQLEDITMRKQAEVDLLQSEEQNRRLIDMMPSGVVVHSGGEIMLVNQAAIKAFGTENPHQLIGTNMIERVHPDYRNVVTSRVQSAAAEGRRADLTEEKLLRLDGSSFDAEVVAIPLIYEGKTSVLALFNNISERKKHAEQLRLLYEAGRELNASLDLRHAYEVIYNAVTQLLPCDTLLVSGFDKNTKMITLVFGWHDGGEMDVSQFPPIPLEGDGKGAQSEVIRTGKPALIPDFQARLKQTDHVYSFDGDGKPIEEIPPEADDVPRSALIVPLIVERQVIGAIQLFSYKPNIYTEDDMRLLNTFASEAAAAIINSQLFQRVQQENLERTRAENDLRQRVAELQTLYESGIAFSQSLSPKDVGQMIVDIMSKKLNWQHVVIRLYHPETEALELLAFNSSILSPMELERHAEERRSMVKRIGDGLSGWAAQHKQIVRNGDITHDPRFVRLVTAPDLNSGLYVPMQLGERVIGVMTIESKEHDAFTEADERLASTLVTQAAIALENARLHQETMSRLQHLQVLQSFDRVITSSLDVRLSLNFLVNELVRIPNVDAAAISLLDSVTMRLEVMSVYGLHSVSLESAHIRPGDGYVGRAVLGGRLQIITDSSSLDQVERADFLRREGYNGYCVAPLLVKGQLCGLLETFHRDITPVDSEWEEFLRAVADQAAIAIDISRLLENLRQANDSLVMAYDAAIDGWSRAMDLRDKETEGHAQRVAEMTVTLCKALGVGSRDMLHIRRGAKLHDIGKMGIPDEILFKPTALTEKEWTIMRTHPQLAHDMLRRINYLQPALDIPYCHHEKWDGSGYPRGLKGEQIPIAARIFAVIDVWDALTSQRSYRKAWSKSKALNHIKEQSGTHFDPQVVKAFVKEFGKK